MLGLVGMGRWGQNLARNFHELGVLSAICDLREERLEVYGRQWPEVALTSVYDRLLSDPSITAIAIATRADSHFTLAKAALQAGKDVYCEKPLCLTLSDATVLAELAESTGRILMVGHLLRYHPAVTRLRGLLDAGDLGNVHYMASSRLNLGVIGMEGSALWDLAPHDVSVLLALCGGEVPTGVRCLGGDYLASGMVDLGILTMEFSRARRAHVHFSWLNPYKEHRLTVIGSKGMAVFDDTAPWEKKLCLFREPIQLDAHNKPAAAAVPPEPVSLESTEPLRVECSHFVRCCLDRTAPRTDGAEAQAVLSVIDAAHTSLQRGGALIVPQPHK